MNVRKDVDYSKLFADIDGVMTEQMTLMELYCEIGRLVSMHPAKGAAVAAAEFIQRAYPDVSGFSARNVRRMREFYLAYEDDPTTMHTAMMIGWTQNVVILESDLTPEERTWYIRAVRQFDWSKLALTEMIKERA